MNKIVSYCLSFYLLSRSKCTLNAKRKVVIPDLNVSLLSSSFVQMIVVASALRKEQMKSEEIISLENKLGRDWKRRKELYKIRNNIERGGV